MQTGWVIILVAVTRHRKHGVIDVGRIGAAFDVGPIVILHHDDEDMAGWIEACTRSCGQTGKCKKSDPSWVQNSIGLKRSDFTRYGPCVAMPKCLGRYNLFL